jgi:flagellar M-ring protein FliF
MDALKRFLNVPASQMIGLAFAIIAVGGFMIGAWTWLQTPDYRVLFTNLNDRDGGAVVQSLTQMNVPYKYNDGGSAIMVPSNMIYDTRLKLASQGLPKGGTVGFELLDQQKFGTTQLQEQMNFQRGLEGELAKSIQSISSVASARVHLAIPKPTIFLREHQKPTASVLVTLFPGRTLDGAQVQGIVHLVASSVPELADQGVSIVDGSGNLLSRTPEVGGLDPGKLAYLHDLEQSYTRRITTLIEAIVGAGNVRAEVTADLDFSQTEQTAETFKPNGPANAAMRSSQNTESTNSNGSAAPAGVPGAQANTPTNAGAPASANGPNAAASSSSSKKDNTVNYELDRTVETKRLPVGMIKRLSAAIVVNNKAVVAKAADAKDAAKGEAKKDAKADAAKAPTSVPLTKEEIDQITAIARETMGFDEKRGDSINVVNTSFVQPEVLPAIETPMWKDPENVSTAKDVGKNVGFALLAAYLLFGVLRPAIRRLTAAAPAPLQVTTTSQVEVSSTPQIAGYPEHLQRARELARNDPKALAGLVRNWVAAE